ncbi:Lsr2 family protein [Sinomonas albida]|uniref:histone-like nucleoid-structuring protein Lsr2 n=1 Tax=Sinomonas albida TaxID=369942 RepID=UPI003017C886
MATKTLVTLHSDISGRVIEPGLGASVVFSLDGISYEIDLTTDETAELRRAVAQHVAVARRDAGRASAPIRHPRPSKPDLAKIRAWAEANGYKVLPRGRIAQSVLNAYDLAAHES